MALPAGPCGSPHPEESWECDLRTEKRKSYVAPRPHPCSASFSGTQSRRAAPFPALLLGLSPEPLWFCLIPTLIPGKASG